MTEDRAISLKEAIEAIRHAEINFSVQSEIDFTKHQREVQEIIDNILDAQEKALMWLPPVTPNYEPKEQDRAISLNAVKDILKMANIEEYDIVAYRNIMQLPPVKPQEPKWIPVSEPPKELGTYLIQTDGEPYMCQCRWTDVNPFWTDYKTKPHWNIFDLPQYSKVVAWMPLPTRYEPQESEG